MKLTSKGRYGVRALFFIAYHHGGRPTQMREVAEKAQIPARFLEQIFHDLKRAGLVRAKRGPNGGYQLAREPALITVGDVVRALEGSPIFAPSKERDDPKDPIAGVFGDLEKNIEKCFDAVTIAEVCARGEKLGLPKQGNVPAPEYAI
ncbi:MAG: Rrf2 family transcriptional regulator [Myxococcales bacterium]|nr:Rrf2 family transcriptional regulator [Myxococcales bacterium]